MRILLFHIPNDGLPTIVDVHMLDADKLLPAVTQPSKNLFDRGRSASPVADRFDDGKTLHRSDSPR